MRLLPIFLSVAFAMTTPIHSAQNVVLTLGEVTPAVTGHKFTEGPVWLPEGALVFSDIPQNRLYRWAPGAETAEIFREPSGHANGNALDADGRLVSCEHDGRVSRTEADGTVKTVADKFEGKRFNSPNDLAIHSGGSIYFTDPPYGLKGRKSETGFNGVYRIATDGNVTLLAKDFDKPNGIAFSPDEKRLYIADTEGNHIRVFDVAADGSISHSRVFAEAAGPDGIKVDSQGNVYCGTRPGVRIYTPDGTDVELIDTPKSATNLNWGADEDMLYITTSDTVFSVSISR